MPDPSETRCTFPRNSASLPCRGVVWPVEVFRGSGSVNVRVVGAGEIADALREALARAGLHERTGMPAAFVCTADDLPRAIDGRQRRS